MLVCSCMIYGILHSQAIPNPVDHVCSRISTEHDTRPTPREGPSIEANQRRVSCSYTELDDFAALTNAQLFNYIINEDDPFNCIYRELFDFNTQFSPSIFSNTKVNYIASQGYTYATNYNGTTNNGLYGIMSFLSIASQMSSYHGLNYSNGTWTKIRNLVHAFSNNTASRSGTSLSLRINAEMYNTLGAPEINGTAAVLNHTKLMLDDLADSGFDNTVNLYDYYYCYYFLLDVYLRFSQSNETHIDAVASNSNILNSLKDVALNTDINDDTYLYFGDISYFSVQSLTRYAPWNALSSVVTPALTAITTEYPEYSVHWSTAAIGLVQNDLPFHIDEEEIITNLEFNLLPNTFEFDNGKFIISTPLDYEKSRSLYEAALQVRAQFFRLMQDDSALANDNNTIIRVKLYGTPADYQNFNGILYNVNYPNSGGVYIEDYGTFYTYERTPEESNYTVEELFRHEYAHYLQGRFLIPGTWGEAPFYSDNRLVWFEEGMAQFLAGSTKTNGIKGINVVRDKIILNGSHQNLSDVLSSSYSSGNFDAFYIYGPMLWSSWYKTDRTLIKDLMGYLRNSQLSLFDNEINYYKNSNSENANFHQHIDQQVPNTSNWITPLTEILLSDQVDFADEEILQTELETASDKISVENVEFTGAFDERRFIITGQIQLPGTIHSEETATVTLGDEMDDILHDLKNTSSINSFGYATAYLEDIQTGVNPSATFHLSGPASESCGRADETRMNARSFSTYAELFPPNITPLKTQFRYREKGTTTWNLLGATSLSTRKRVDNVTSLKGYEYQIRYECSEDMWSTYSEKKSFYPCPDQRDLSNLTLTFDASFRASEKVKSANTILSGTKVEFVAGDYVDILPGFEIKKGARVLIDGNDCRVRQ